MKLFKSLPPFIIALSVVSPLAATKLLADHEPVTPLDLYLNPSKDVLDNAKRQAEAKRHAAQQALENEQKRIEEFKRNNASNFVNLPPLSEGRAERLDALFAILQENRTKELAEKAAREIQRTWSQSGSETIDLMFTWATTAMEQREYAKALDYFDNIIVLQPDFAEAWNRRATVHYLREDYSRSIADVQKTLALEPRHYGALRGLGIMLRRLGRDSDALAALERALEVNPTLKSLENPIAELSKTVKGRES